MKKFMDADFLLETETAKRLYHDMAENLPIVDYHCHINPREIAEDRQFENITQVLLGGDHYKWRLMRSNGVPEEEITGDADDFTKFRRFAEALEKAIGNPMYHWTHLELRRYFGCTTVLSGQTAGEVWNFCNAKLAEGNLSVRRIIEKSRVEFIGTTDDPCDDLHWHEKLAADDSFAVTVAPTFRPDKAVNIDKEGFPETILLLAKVTGRPIQSFSDVCRALEERLDYFCRHGCRASDHGLDSVPFEKASLHQLNEIFQKAMQGEKPDRKEADAYKTGLLCFCAGAYARRDMVMQLHYGALRNPNTRMFRKLGPDTGFDTVNHTDCLENLAAFLNELDVENELPKTVLYSLNPHDNVLLDTIIGSFQGSEIPGKLQHGSAWWFNDHKVGMTEQLTGLGNLSVLGNFIGMLTDSRSFLSYTRHEYFRRILCNFLGSLVENGEYPNDEKALRGIVEGICYRNAVRYFKTQNPAT